MLLLGTSIYSTTEYGGAYYDGTVFTIPSKGAEKVLHSFGSGSDGWNPTADVIAVGGKLYGTTVFGDDFDCNGGCGTVFALSP